VKGPSQNLARNESERDSAAWAGEPADEGEAQHRNPSRDWRRDEWNRDVCDRGRPRPLAGRPTTSLRNRRAKGDTERVGAAEESERFIVAMTPGESREQQRDRSRGRVAIDVCASKGQRTE
jgi:hypothetical protein